MGQNSKAASGADAAGNLLYFSPEKLTLVTDENHPLYDERVHLPVDEALVRSIIAHGIIQPINIRLNGKTEDGAPIVEVVTGRRRVKAALEANRRIQADGGEPVRVPAVVKRTDRDSLMGVVITENEVREGDSPVLRAKKLARYLATGRTEEEAAVTFGCTTATIRNMLKLLELHPKVQKVIESGKLPATVAKELATLPQEEQPAALAKLEEVGATKGARGVEAARNVRKSGSAESSKTLRMMSKPAIEQWRNRHKKSEGKDAQVAYAVLSRLLGHERALADLPRVKAALEAADA